MFTSDRKINFYDCDPAGIIFYSRIFEFCHSAYEELIASFELEENYWQNEDYVVPIIHTEAEYIKPFKYGDDAKIEITVTQLRDSSFELSYSLLRNSEIFVSAKTVHVFVDKRSWEKKNVPENIKEGLKNYLDK